MATEKRLIDANALTKAHCEGCATDIQEMCKTDPVCASMMWVVEAPTVDAVEVVHGRWKAHKPDCLGHADSFVCSHCRDIVYTDYSMKECEYNYCPNCGAKMDGDGNE